MTKTCLKCSENKQLSEFHKNKNVPDGHSRYCKSCADGQNTKSRKKNPGLYQAISIKSSRKFRDQIREWKSQQRCARCPERHPACLELHHLDPTKKDFHPSDAPSMKRFLEEAAKCIVLCANCHRKEHYVD